MKKLWLKIKYYLTGVVCVIPCKEGSAKLKTNGWVYITDGNSTDALPVIMISEEMQQKLFDTAAKIWGVKDDQ